MTAQRVLITGGAGFIGSHLADALIDRGHEVAVVDNLSSGQNNTPAAAKLFELDIRGDELPACFADFRPDAVFHHAAQMDVRASVADPSFDADVNIIGTLRLLEQCIRHDTGRFYFASTGGAIYGEQDFHPAPETHPTRPVSPYGCSKLAIEHYLHYYHVEHGLRACALRYANVYGPRQNAHGEAGVVAIFAERLLRGDSCTIFGDGEQTRDFVYVADVVAANLAAFDHSLGGCYNVGTGIETNVNQIYAGLAEALAIDKGPVHGDAKPGEQRRSSLDAKRLQHDGGWQLTVPLGEGLARTAHWFRDR